MYAILWEFRVRPGREQEFERAIVQVEIGRSYFGKPKGISELN